MGRGSLLGLHSKKFLLLTLCAPKGKVLGEREPRLDRRPPSCALISRLFRALLSSTEGSVPFHVTVCVEMGQNRGKV